MRILLTSNYKMGNETGSSHVTDLLAMNLSKKNIVCYLCVGKKYKIKRSSKTLTIIEIPSVEINNIVVPVITPNTAIKLESDLAKFSPDIVHTQNSILISKYVQTWAKNNRVPIVTTFHHIPTQALRHVLPKMPNNIFTKAIEGLYSQTSIKSFLKNINGVIALNKNQENEIKKVDKNIKITIINNGLDLSKYHNLKKGNLKTNINFVFMGSYIERKNQEFLVKVFKYLPENYHLTCYGNIGSGKKYYEQINSIKPSNVTLSDFTKDVIGALKKSDFFISASLKEVQSLAVIYAMAAGLPIIGLANETTNEIVDKTNGLKLNKTISAKMFANEVVKFVDNSRYLELSKKSQEDSKRFKVDQVITKIESFYREIISDN